MLNVLVEKIDKLVEVVEVQGQKIHELEESLDQTQKVGEKQKEAMLATVQFLAALEKIKFCIPSSSAYYVPKGTQYNEICSKIPLNQTQQAYCDFSGMLQEAQNLKSKLQTLLNNP